MITADPRTREEPNLSLKETLLHHVAAWGAVLCLLAGLWHRWMIPAGGREWPVRIWPGHLLIDALEVAVFTLAGLTAGGWWWWAAGWRRGAPGIAGAVLLAATGFGALYGWLPQRFVFSLLGLWLAWGMAGAIFFRRPRPDKLAAWCRERRPWNVIFFCSFVLLNTMSDVLMTGTAPPGWLAAAGFIAGRLLTQLVLAAGLWLLLLLGARWWPRGAGWAGWTAVALAPLAVAADMALRLMWTKSLHHLCAEIENDGNVDFFKIREGAGVEITTGQVVLIAACLLAAPVWFLLCGWLSRRGGWRISGARLGATALAAWVTLMALHLVESLSKPGEWRHWESRAARLQLTPFSPPPGLVTFRVTPANPPWPAPAPAPVTAARHPDIFYFIVETMRADAISPERTPFLARWKEEDCQPLADTRSAANATHLSWFSLLHGRLPYFFEEVRTLSAPAPLLSLLHAAGYAVEVRSGGNFDYCEMFTSNFGDGSGIRIMKHVPEGHPDRALPMPEREKRLMQQLHDAVTQSPPGGVLWLTTIDSGHYPYRWHKQWTPPYADYEVNPLFPVRPTPEEIMRVQHRYWNSVAWGDHLIGDFISFLKNSGRYDDAMIILTGDHGEEFKEYGSWFHCSALNTPQTSVPILIKWPKSLGRGPDLADASHLDLVPSILDAAGIPESVWQGMPGRSLRREGSATSIMTTSYNSQNGEAMVWRRDSWEAAFSWSSPWVLAPPEKLWLERLEGPQGLVKCAGPAEYETELRRHFPDAFDRVFTKCERASQ